MMENKKDSAYYADFEERVTNALLDICAEHHLIVDISEKKDNAPRLLESEDLEIKWKQIAPEYMADAVPQFEQFPEVSIAWSAYVGMALAVFWDRDWAKEVDNPKTYYEIRDPQGFDNMDEYVASKLLDLDLKGEEFAHIQNLLLSCATTAVDLMRKENVEPGSVEAFNIYARVVHTMFKIGVAIALKGLGYKYHKVDY